MGGIRVSKVYTVHAASLGHTVVVPSLDCYTVGNEFADWLTKITPVSGSGSGAYSFFFNGNGCTQDANGVLTAFTLEEYRSTGVYVGSTPSGALTVGTYTGVDSGVVVPADVSAVFAGVFVPMVSLYLVGYAIRKVLHMIEGRKT